MENGEINTEIINTFSCQMSGQVVRTFEDKNKMKAYDQKVISLYGQLYPYRLGMGQHSMRVKNGKNKDLEQGKADCRIQILELARSSSKKKQKRIRDEQKKMVLQLQLGSRLDWKRVETFQASHKLNSD